MIIGLAGGKGSGKSTVADHLVRACGFSELSFADPIRRFVRHLTGYTEATKEDPIDWLDGRHSARTLMQTVGTEWGRDMIHPQIWVRFLARQLETPTWRGRPVVVSDVRFPNEVDMIRSLGGFIVQVDRPKRRSWLGMALRTVRAIRDRHISEAGIAPQFIDHRITNAGSLGDLKAAAQALPDLLRTKG